MLTSAGERFFAPHPLALLCAAFSAGILLARISPFGLTATVLIAALASLCSLVILLKGSYWFATFFLLLATTLAGVTVEKLEQRYPPAHRLKRLMEERTIANQEDVEVIGILDRPLEYTPDGFYLTLKIQNLRIKGVEQIGSGVLQLLASVRDSSTAAQYEALNLNYGTRVRLATALERSDEYRNPGVSSRTEFLDLKEIDATCQLKGPRLIERLDDVRVFPPLLWLYKWRRSLEQELHRYFSRETAGVLDAALLGNRYFLSRGSAERFREGGTFHVLVISGLHISFIGGLVLLLARRISDKRWLQFLLSITVLWSYTLGVGAEASVVRSAVMFSFIALAPVLSRSASSLNGLGGAGILLLLWQPKDLFDPSSQLTFLSVLAIVVIAVPLLNKVRLIGSWRPIRRSPHPPTCAPWLVFFCEVLYWSEKKWRAEIAEANFSYRLFKTPVAALLERLHLQAALRHAVAALVVTASVQISLLPLLLIYFHRVSISSLPLNIFVSGLMALLSLVALVGICAAQLSLGLAEPLLACANALNWLMVHGVDLFDHPGLRALRLPEYSGGPALVYVIYYFPLIVLVWGLARWHPLELCEVHRTNRWNRRIVVAVVFQVILLCILILHPFSRPRPNGKLTVDFLDVGQGDAALVTMPDGTTILIDGGGRPNFVKRTVDAELDSDFQRDTRSIGEAVVSEYLWWRGLDSIDFVLATHADADHMDGLNDIVRNFEVRSALLGRTPLADPEYAKFVDSLNDRNVPVNVIGAGDVLRFGDVTGTVFWPVLSANVDAPSRNNDSVVLRLKYGERSILMTGDVEKEGEAAIIHSGVELQADVVKVPHHGSKTSSTDDFVQSSHPQFAVISVGRNSIFGHPRPEIVERWKAARAAVMTTGNKGTITVTTNGRDLRVETFVR